MATPFIVGPEEALVIWNELVEKMEFEFVVPDTGEGTTPAHTLTNISAPNAANLSWTFAYRLLMAYDKKLEDFLRERQIL